MDGYLRFKPALKKFDYPNVGNCTDEEITKIFSLENRFFLLTWLSQTINSVFKVPSDWSEQSQASFANFFHEGGLCSRSQKEEFVVGTLGQADQMVIFDRIFYFIEISSCDDKTESQSKEFSVEDLQEFLKKDINLFPSLGPLKLRTPEERKQKFDELQEKIQKFTDLQKDQQEMGANVVLDKPCTVDREEVKKNLKGLEEHLKVLKETCDILPSPKLEETVGFKGDICKQLKEFTETLSVVVQYFRTLKFMESLNVQPLTDPLEEDETTKFIKQLCEQVSEAAEMLRNVKKGS